MEGEQPAGALWATAVAARARATKDFIFRRPVELIARVVTKGRLMNEVSDFSSEEY